MGTSWSATMADPSPGRLKAEGQLGNVSEILEKLKNEVAYLQDEVEAKGAGFYVPLAQQLNVSRASIKDLTLTLDTCNGSLQTKDAARLAAQLAAMQDNHAMKKLKMHFAKIAGLAKSQTFKALTISCRQAKARKMLDGEAGKRLKAFLKSKLAGILRRCYTAIIANHDAIACENLKNNDKAKKVGMMLEKLARGLVHRIFMAFIRHFQECAEERAAMDAINGRLAGLDEANRAKLKVFLMGKEKAAMMMFFKQWVQVASEKGLLELYEMLDKEEAMRIAAEEELAALLGA